MMMPLSEAFDKLSIALLKAIRGGQKTGAEVSAYVDYLADIRTNLSTAEIPIWLADLIKHNNDIWSLESDIRRGKENELPLEEVGRRAIKIREHNKKRVEVKNTIASIINSGFVEVKADHASE